MLVLLAQILSAFASVNIANMDLVRVQDDPSVSVPHGKFGSSLGSDAAFQYTCRTEDGNCLVGSEHKLKTGGRCYCSDEDGDSYGTLR